MSRPLKVLIIDDSESDSVLVVKTLSQNGFDVSSVRVDSEAELKKELLKQWDIITCDCIMPCLSAMDVLSILRRKKIKIPVIILTGIFDYTVAPELIAAGASDFVLKTDMSKLVLSIEREISKQKQTIKELIKNEEKKIIETSPTVKKKPFMTIRRRVIISFAIIISSIVFLGVMILLRGINNAGRVSFQKASVGIELIASNLEIFRLHKTETFSKLNYIEEYLKDGKKFKLYKFEIMEYSLKNTKSYGNIDKEILKKIKPEDIQKVLNDGIIRAVDVRVEKMPPRKIIFARMENRTEIKNGIVVLDYTEEYLAQIKYWKFYIIVLTFIFLIVLSIVVSLGYFLAKKIFKPIKVIKKVINEITNGDLSESVQVKEYDEMGELAYAFEIMRISLVETFTKMNFEINERDRAEKALKSLHLKLTLWVDELDKRTQELDILNKMGKMLESCKTMDEFRLTCNQYLKQIFPEDFGAIYIFNVFNKFLEIFSKWGNEPIEESFVSDDCWSMREGNIYLSETSGNFAMLCPHIHSDVSGKFIKTFCLPMMAQGKIFGLFHLRSYQKDIEMDNIKGKIKSAKEQLVIAANEHITIAFSNLKNQETLKRQSIVDVLTGLYNRRYMNETLELEIYRATRHNSSFGVIMFDIDLFKKFNEEYGHDLGDLVLEKIGLMVKTVIRPEDIASRYGGDEFFVILPGADLEGTNQCAIRLMEEARKLKVQDKSVILGGISLSIGVSVYPGNGNTSEEIIKTADETMFQAKKTGRDRIVLNKKPTEE